MKINILQAANAAKRFATGALVALMFLGSAEAQTSSSLWQDVAERGLGRPMAGRQLASKNYRVLTVDRQGLAALLESAPLERPGTARAQGLVLELPMPRGGFQRFSVEESPIMEPALAVQFPEIKTYRAQGIDDPTATARLDLTPQGFHGMIIAADETTYIDPYSRDDANHYVSYLKKDFSKVGAEPFKCEVHGVSHPLSDHKGGKASRAANGTTLRTYRIAVAATGEYTTFHGGTVAGAQAAITTTINRNTGIYERDLAVRFTLVSAPGAIYTNAATDPYANNSTDIDKNTGVLDGLIGSAAYDIGHVFQSAPGGVAYLGSVCDVTQKGGGVTGTNNPVGDPFDVDYVAHEIGHQFSGNHSFNGTASACSTRNAGTAAEVGSGSTIQAYAGICGVENIQQNTDDMFHSVSLDEMQAFITTGGGSTCGTTAATGNTPPTVSVASATYTIPKGTPFMLTATGADANSDSLTYSWEDRSLGTASSSAATAQTDDGSRPLFRAYRPSTSGTRLFPKLTDILGTTPATTFVNGETLPTTARTLTFNVTVRDNRANGGGTNDARVVVTIDGGSGPFRTMNLGTATSLNGGATQNLTWDIANTTAAPVSCANVAIGYSNDGGANFTDVLASTPNDGSQDVTVPNASTTNGRFRIGCANNIFFDITKGVLTVTAVTSTPGPPTITAVLPGDGSVTVEFTPPSNNGGSAINGYKATCGSQVATGTASPITVTGLTNGTAVTCTVEAQNSLGLGTPSAASASVTPGAVPTVTTPSSASVAGASATLGGNVTAAGGSTITERGVVYALTSANPSPQVGGIGVTKVTATGTTGVFTAAVSGLTPASGYSFRAYATNGAGTAYSSVATFSTLEGTTIPRLVNISTRGLVATGDNIMIGGFIVGGSGPKKVIIKGRGPSLATLGVPGTLADPAILLFSGATQILNNDNWGTSTNAADITASGQAPTNASEAAILTTVTPGIGYTVHMSGVGGTSGIGIVEVFELDKPEVPLLNISTRGPVLTGDHVLIGGFIIQGNASQQVLITAKGPSLGASPINLPGSLPDPILELYQAGNPVPIDSNDNWGEATNAAAIGAAGNAPTSPLESAILRTLAPGAYTAIVKGKGAFQGIGQVEVYRK